MQPSGPPQTPPGVAGGWRVEHVAETGSTNADLLEAADRLPGRTVRRTDHQTAGRGRLDRRWDAPPGTNLLVSFLFRDDDPAGVPGGGAAAAVVLMRRLGIAAVAAARATVGAEARLKWPNDVLLDGRKLAGMLAQRAPGVTVIGLGLNVGWAPDGAARLGDVAPADVLATLLAAFDEFAGATPAEVHARYTGLLDTIGRRVRVEMPGDAELVGRATGVEPDGRLIVLDACAVTHRVDVGDVVHVRPA